MTEILGNIILKRCKNWNCEDKNHVFFVCTARRTSATEFKYEYYGTFGGDRFRYSRGCIHDIAEEFISANIKAELIEQIAYNSTFEPGCSTFQTHTKWTIEQEITPELILEWTNKTKQ